MIFSKYGVELIRLEMNYLEMLRQWRNDFKIVQYMEYQEYITATMQQTWFEGINNLDNFYFIIRFKEQYIGLIHLSTIDWEVKVAEAGLFIANQNYIVTPTPVAASLAILDFAFHYLKIDNIKAKVNVENDQAINYNKHLGFEYQKKALNPNFIWLELTKQNYLQHTQKLQKTIRLLYGVGEELHFDLSEIDLKIKEVIDQNKENYVTGLF